MPIFKVGTDDFKELRDDGGYFVDKSLLIKEVIAGSKALLLPRPRRFGKTLNLSMLRYFFEHTPDDHSYLFQDLAIASLPEVMAKQGKYPVIFLSLKDVKGNNWEESWTELRKNIRFLFRRHAYLLDSLESYQRVDFNAVLVNTGHEDLFRSSLKDIIQYLYEYHRQPVVVLIDEYDSPMIEAWDKGYYHPMADFMRSWLGGGLKHVEGAAVYRSVVTGILRIAKESIFSGLNNLDVWSTLSPGPFADKFGFTEEDVRRILLDFGQESASENIRAWYNGYNFGGVTIYNPWSVSQSVNRFPSAPEPHWLNTASSQLVLTELERGGMELKRDLEKLLAGEELRYPISNTITFEDIGRNPEHIWSFLYAAGYLKAEKPAYDPLDTTTLTYALSLPNLEVAQVYKQFITRYFNEQLQWNNATVQDWLQSLLHCDWPRFEALLQELVDNLFSCHDTGKFPEAVFHAFTLGLLANLRGIYEIHSNPETGYGRADILLRPRSECFPLGFVIEFKSLPAERNLEQAVSDALAQIEVKQYARRLLEAGVPAEQIRQLAVVVSGRRVKVRAEQGE